MFASLLSLPVLVLPSIYPGPLGWLLSVICFSVSLASIGSGCFKFSRPFFPITCSSIWLITSFPKSNNHHNIQIWPVANFSSLQIQTPLEMNKILRRGGNPREYDEAVARFPKKEVQGKHPSMESTLNKGPSFRKGLLRWRLNM